MFSSEAWLAKSGGFYNGVATQSLRFDQSSSARLEKTPNASNRKVWTWGAWVKRTKIGDERAIWSVGGSAHFALFFHNSTHQLRVWSNSGEGSIYTNRVFRDTSAWYHICLTSKNSGNYYELYVNGVKETSFSLDQRSSYPAGNDTEVNSNDVHYIGAWNNGGLQYFDGYLADVNFIDGTCVGDTNGILDELGELKNGVWIPKKYTGSYGTNGYRLEFKQTGVGTASTSTIGADTSGNTNHYTSSGIVASDCNMPDSPENNFSTWNALFTGGEQSPDTIYTAPVLSNGNLEVSLGGNSYMGNNFRPTSGKWYAEIRLKTLGSTNGEVTWGWLVANTYVGNRTGNPPLADLFSANWLGYSSTGNILRLFDETSQLGSNITATVSAGNILQLALDIDNNKGFIGINNAWAYSGNLTGGDPANGTNPTFTFTDDEAQNLQWYVANGTSTDVHVANFGQDSTFGGAISAGGNADANGIGDFQYMPSGFLALCSANLPEPTISPNADTQADDHFNTHIYSGNNNATRTFDVGFVSDWSWFKARNQTNYGHQLYDSSRGVQKKLVSNSSGAETTNSEGVIDFDDSGTLLKIGTDAFLNESGTDMVIWNWKANGSTTSTIGVGSVSSGVPSIASTVQVNTTSGFSIVTFTGNNTNDATIGHGLGTTPAMIITKNRDDSVNWRVWHKDLQSTYTFFLASDLYSFAPSAQSNGYIKTVGSTTYSTYQANVDSNGVNGASDAMVAYCFAEVEGYSKFGVYTGNGVTSGDGTFVFLGFRPAFIIIKNSTASAEWVMVDNVRSTFNEVDDILVANDGSKEADFGTTNRNIDFLSNGFKIRSNAAGGTTALVTASSKYIYMAFAEAPFKYANAR